MLGLERIPRVHAGAAAQAQILQPPPRMRGTCSCGLIAMAMVGALVACNQSEKQSAVRTPERTGTASSAASSTDGHPTGSTLDPFDRQVQSYLDQTKPLRDEAAKAAHTLTGKNNRPA